MTQCNFSIPPDIITKYKVETVTEPIEKLIEKKITSTKDKEEAFYFVDLATIIRKLKNWKGLLPRVKPFYAMKCNPNPVILASLAEMGVNFDCASKAEIQQILEMGVSPSRIIYANPTKMKSHISYAKTVGVDLMTFDNACELRKIAEIFPESRLILRIITDDSQSLCKFSSKFGAPIDQATNLLSLAKSLNLNVVGVSFHAGSGCKSALSFALAVKNAKQIFDQASKIGYHLTTLDLGGGWPGTDQEGVSFSEIADVIRPILDRDFSQDVEIIAEPGRYFVAESHTLAVNVFGKRIVESQEGKSFLYYINDGVYQSFNCILFDHAIPKPEFLPDKQITETFTSTLFGPTCDSLDCVGRDILLPELEIGEWIYFRNMGAYTVAAASSFNGFKSNPQSYYVVST